MLNNLILSGIGLLNLLIPPSVIEVVKNPIAMPVYAQNLAPSETLEQKIDRVALEHNIASSSLYNLINSESSMNPDVKDGDMSILCGVGINKGLPVRARGITQITQCYHPEISDSEAYDLDFSINLAAQQIASGTAWKEHTACNCYTYMKTLIPHLPAMKDIIPNIDRPIVGGLVLFNYHGVPHWGYITKITDNQIGQTYHIKEANFETCKLDERDVSSLDSHISGYWTNLRY